MRKRQKKNVDSNQETLIKIRKKDKPIGEQVFLTVRDAAQLLNMSTKTIYRLIEKNDLNAFNFSERKTLIRRKDIDFYFDANLKIIERQNNTNGTDFDFENSYTINEAMKKFNISNGFL